MKKFAKILLKIFIVIAIVFLAFGILVISIQSEKVPEIYIYSNEAQAKAVIGNYTWNAFSEVLRETSFTKDSYILKNENTLLVAPNERIILANSQTIATRQRFMQNYFEFIDTDGNVTIIPRESSANSYGEQNYIEFNAPEKEDTYTYYFTLNYYEKGTVDYAVKIVVSAEPIYNIQELQSFKNIKINDYSNLYKLLSTLPYSRSILNLMVINKETCKIVVKYENIMVDRDAFIKNAIAIFALIPEVNEVEFLSDDIMYDFSRNEIEIIQGRDVTEYAENAELWENEVLYKEKIENKSNTSYKAFIKIAKDVFNISSGEKYLSVNVDTNTFSENTSIEFDNANRYKFLMGIQEYAQTIYDVPFEKYLAAKNNDIFICAEKIPEPSSSGDEITEQNEATAENKSNDLTESGESEAKYSGDEVLIYMRRNRKEYHYVYFVDYASGDWNIVKVDN